VLTSHALGRGGDKNVKIPKGELTFVQISDSHMGFDKPANPDVVSTFQAAIDSDDWASRRISERSESSVALTRRFSGTSLTKAPYLRLTIWNEESPDPGELPPCAIAWLYS
jgi:hypothetical protein